MTMQIKPGQLIAGLDAKVLRDFLRKCDTGFDQDWIIKDLKLTSSQALPIINALLREQYIEPDSRWQERFGTMPRYCPTRKGRELMRASAAARISRKTAQTALDGFMQRVHEVNRNPRYLCSITKVAVFGSFLKDLDRLGDVDVAVETGYRIPDDDNSWRVIQQYARNSGRNFPTVVAEQYWPIHEIMLVLKVGKRTLRIEPWYSFTGMEKTPDFTYKVLLGDEKAIRRDLEQAERKRKEDSKKNGSEG